MSNAPLVSVAMITYKHRSFVGQAIESVLNQKRDFPIEIVISDDCSPDGTASIIDEYQSAHPELFRRLDPPRNVGMHSNLDRVWQACNGKYVATLEGDDWWHSTDKLAIQVDFMERFPECAISGHSVDRVRTVEGKMETSRCHQPRPELADIEALIQSNYIMTCSAMFRRGLVASIPDWVRSLALCDWPLFLLHALHGKVGYINTSLATYRTHAGGVWSSLGTLKQHRQERESLVTMRQYFPRRYRKSFDSSLEEACFNLYYTLRNSGDYRGSLRSFMQHLLYAASSSRLKFRMLVRYPPLFLYLVIAALRAPRPVSG